MEEDDTPLRNAGPLELLLREPLETLSVEELEKRIAKLHREIARCESAIEHKKDVLGAAHDFFRN